MRLLNFQREGSGVIYLAFGVRFFDVREGQRRLNRWMGHYVLHPPLPSVGVVPARKGFASPLRALDWLPLLKMPVSRSEGFN